MTTNKPSLQSVIEGVLIMTIREAMREDITDTEYSKMVSDRAKRIIELVKSTKN